MLLCLGEHLISVLLYLANLVKSPIHLKTLPAKSHISAMLTSVFHPFHALQVVFLISLSSLETLI